MFPVRELVELILKTLPVYFWRPELTMVVGVVLFLVYRQYKRVAQMEAHLFGRPKASPWRRTGEGLLYGMAGGLLATALFLLLGISLNDMGIWYLWPVAFLLFLLHPRFLCFAYAGGIVSLWHLLTGWPEVHVPSMMALVALLHLVEAVLIWWHGARGATPVYVRHPRGGVVGGYTLQKFWPLPFVALLSVILAGEMPVEELLSMPDWWPLIAADRVVPEGFQRVFVLFPVVAALGYGDIALTRSPREKARRTSLTLLAYSGVLMILALLAHHVPWVAWPAALFSPLGHEWVIAWGRRSEEQGEPRYRAGDRPVILDVLPGSPGDKMGLRPGDRLLEVNGQPVWTKAQVHGALMEGSVFLGLGWRLGVGELVVEREGEGILRFRRAEGLPYPLGMILVPEPYDVPFVDLRDRSRYARIIQGLGRFFGRRRPEES